MKTRHHAGLVMLALVLQVEARAQDVIKLKNGELLEGIIVGETESTITLQFPGGTIQLLQSQIATVTRNAEPRSAEAAEALLSLSRLEESAPGSVEDRPEKSGSWGSSGTSGVVTAGLSRAAPPVERSRR